MNSNVRKKLYSIVVVFLFLFMQISMGATSTASPEAGKFIVVKGSTDPSYNGEVPISIPILTIPGRGGFDYPLSLSYKAGIQPQSESGSVGLGWSIDTGRIVRGISGYQDDMKKQGHFGNSMSSYGCIDESTGINHGCFNNFTIMNAAPECVGKTPARCMGSCRTDISGSSCGCAVASVACMNGNHVTSCGTESCANEEDLTNCIGGCSVSEDICVTDYDALPDLEVEGTLFSIGAGRPGDNEEGNNLDNWFMSSPAGSSQMLIDENGKF